ncbi:MAG TPA: methyltransferase domain-containing protein [Acidobacteriota bacterium]|nr:methyltransferase domain-containing protein [Acidobacteriota bacterium]
MVKPRVIETGEGIQDELTVEAYDIMQRHLRDRGWIETDQIIKSGIDKGVVLEIGPGPGFIGLEWPKKTEGTKLNGLEISPTMIETAEKNAREYGVEARAKYVKGDAVKMPFENDFFDGVFSNGSLHEWSQPERVFDEVFRVLKSGGTYFISDMRRNMSPFMKWFMKLVTKPKEMQPGLKSSINASYTVEEIKSILATTSLKEHEVKKLMMGFVVTGAKNLH